MRYILALAFIIATKIHAAEVGRFQLFSGSIERMERPMPVVLKIDTQTGETWQLLEVPANIGSGTSQTFVTAWTPVSADLITQLRKLEGARIGTNAAPGKR